MRKKKGFINLSGRGLQMGDLVGKIARVIETEHKHDKFSPDDLQKQRHGCKVDLAADSHRW